MDACSNAFLVCLGIMAFLFLIPLLVNIAEDLEILDRFDSVIYHIEELISNYKLNKKIHMRCDKGNHEWNGCTCLLCGKVRNQGHKYHKTVRYGEPVSCAVCGKTCDHRTSNGDLLWVKGCKCKECGNTLHKPVVDDEWWDDSKDIYKIRCHCSSCGVEF